MTGDNTEYRHYHNSAKAGFEEWAIGISREGNVRIRQGPTGRPLRLTEQPASSASEAERIRSELIAAKLDEGYAPVGSATIERGRLSTRPAPQERGLSWAVTTAIEQATMIDCLRRAAEQLNCGPLDERVVFAKEESSIRVYGVKPWTLGYIDQGGLRRSDGRGGGTITSDQGLLPRLILIYLQRQFPGCIQISDAADNLVVPQIMRRDPVLGECCFDFRQVLELGSRLSLCLDHSSVMVSGSSDSSAFFF